MPQIHVSVEALAGTGAARGVAVARRLPPNPCSPGEPPRSAKIEASVWENLLHRNLRLPDECPRLGKSRGYPAGQGLQPGGGTRRRSPVLYNTCSIRDKAEQKVFNRLQQFKREAGKGKLFGVLGCVAQQEGERIFERAPHVSLVAGSASYTKLGELLVRLEAGERRVTGLSLDTEETFETPLTARDNPHRAYITIIEGCDKSCAYCVVPFTRGPERSRTAAGILEEARRLADQGYTEIQLLGQNVNSYRDPSPARWDFAQLLAGVARRAGDTPRSLHHFAPARFRQAHRGCHERPSGYLQPRPPAGAVGIHPRAGSHATPVHPGRIPGTHRLAEGFAPEHFH